MIQTGYVPREKPRGFWTLRSTIFILQEVQWDQRARRAAMQLMNCTYGELCRGLQRALEARLIKRRKPVPVLTLRQRLVRAERAAQASANPALRVYLAGLGSGRVRVQEGPPDDLEEGGVVVDSEGRLLGVDGDGSP